MPHKTPHEKQNKTRTIPLSPLQQQPELTLILRRLQPATKTFSPHQRTGMRTDKNFIDTNTIINAVYWSESSFVLYQFLISFQCRKKQSAQVPSINITTVLLSALFIRVCCRQSAGCTDHAVEFCPFFHFSITCLSTGERN